MVSTAVYLRLKQPASYNGLPQDSLLKIMSGTTMNVVWAVLILHTYVVKTTENKITERRTAQNHTKWFLRYPYFIRREHPYWSAEKSWSQLLNKLHHLQRMQQLSTVVACVYYVLLHTKYVEAFFSCSQRKGMGKEGPVRSVFCTGMFVQIVKKQVTQANKCIIESWCWRAETVRDLSQCTTCKKCDYFELTLHEQHEGASSFTSL